MRFEKFLRRNKSDNMSTSGLAGSDGVVRAGNGGSGQVFSRRKAIEHNRQYVAGYHLATLHQQLPPTANSRNQVPVIQRTGQPLKSSPPERPAGGIASPGHHFREPPSRRPPGY